MSNFLLNRSVFLASVASCLFFTTSTLGQRDSDASTTVAYLPMYVTLLISVCAAVTGFILWRRSKRPDLTSQYNYSNRMQSGSHNSSYDEGVDAEKELEWFRKAKKATSVSSVTQRKSVAKSPKVGNSVLSANAADQAEIREYQDRLNRQQYANLPINSFLQLNEPKDFTQLPLSGDPALISAIEQTNEEFEDDEAVREIALRILQAFKTRNSVDALAQIALYDLSSNLRSKAVATLTEFDHESVFETILLACADPTREVRAAAARGLFRLNFDRADAWKRIIATRDEFRMRHAARAATESGIVLKSLDRLIHYEMKIAYEAFALVGLMIKSGETEQIFDTIKNGKEERVKFALLHVLSVIRDDRARIELNKLRIDATLTDRILEKVNATVESYIGIRA